VRRQDLSRASTARPRPLRWRATLTWMQPSLALSRTLAFHSQDRRAGRLLRQLAPSGLHGVGREAGGGSSAGDFLVSGAPSRAGRPAWTIRAGRDGALFGCTSTAELVDVLFAVQGLAEQEPPRLLNLEVEDVLALGGPTNSAAVASYVEGLPPRLLASETVRRISPRAPARSALVDLRLPAKTPLREVDSSIQIFFDRGLFDDSCDLIFGLGPPASGRSRSSLLLMACW
jgi:hypothetical protein